MRRLIDLFNHTRLQPFRFLIVGAVATMTHMLVIAVVFAIYSSPSPYAANLIAFLVAFLVSFYGHRHITFQARGSIRRFLTVAIGGFLANNAILTAALAIDVDDFIAVMVATVFVPVLTYLASSLWAFTKES